MKTKTWTTMKKTKKKATGKPSLTAFAESPPQALPQPLRGPCVLGFLCVFLLALSSPKAHAETERVRVVCPVDGRAHLVRVHQTSNRSGGRDSDGCVYALKGTHVHVLSRVQLCTCPSCFFTIDRHKLPKTLTETSKQRLLAAIKKTSLRLPKSLTHGDELPFETRVVLAQACYQALHGQAQGPQQSLKERQWQASLWLSAAWEKRKRIIAEGGVSSFRPQNLRSGLSAFKQLNQQIQSRQQSSNKDLKRLESLLEVLTELRSDLETNSPEAVERFRSARRIHTLMALEMGLLKLKALAQKRTDMAAEALRTTELRALKLRRIQAAVRLGFTSQARQSLRELKFEKLPKGMTQSVQNIELWLDGAQADLKRALTALQSIPIKKLASQDLSKACTLGLLRADLERRLEQKQACQASLKVLAQLLKSQPAGSTQASGKALGGAQRAWLSQRIQLLERMNRRS